MGTSRCLATAIPLAALMCLGAWTATAFGQATPPLPTVSVTLPSVPPVPPVAVPPVTVPPVAVPAAPVPAPTAAPLPVPAPRAPATPALPGVSPTPGSSAARSSAAPAIPTVGGSAASSSAPESSGPAGESNGAATSSAGSSDADGDESADAERLLQRRRVAARRVRETRNVRPVPARFSNRGRTRSSTVLVFWLARPGRVVFTVLGEAPSCRALGSFAAGGRAGVNRVRYRGRLNGRPLPPGRYTLVPRVYRAGSVTRLERVAIEILPANARTPLWRRTALAPVECRGDQLAGVWDSAAAGDARFPARVATPPEPAWSGGVKAAHKTVPSARRSADEPREREEVAVEVPFYTEGDGDQTSLFAGVLLAGLGLAFMTMFVLVVRFLRGTWNP